MGCCDAHLELFYLKTLKPRLDAIDRQLELLVQEDEREDRLGQEKINALTEKAQKTLDLDTNPPPIGNP